MPDAKEKETFEMSIPQSLQTCINEALEQIEQHPSHAYYPEKRGILISELMKHGELGINTRRWAAFFAGQYVLPIFENYEFSENLEKYKSSARDILTMAEDVLLGRMSIEKAQNEVYILHDIVPNARLNFPINVGFAWSTSYRVLTEAANYDLFWQHRNLYRMDKDGNLVRVTNERLTDAYWIHTGGGDTASTAIFTYAWDSNKKIIEPRKSFEFWQWWLTKAIPDGWSKASDRES